MGLTIHYGLTFQGNQAEALNKIKAMRSKAMDMSFVEVSEVSHFVGKECDYNSYNTGDERRWALIQAQGTHIIITPDGRLLKSGGESFNGCCYITPQPIEIILFKAWAGDGCEESNFGLCHYPATIYHQGKTFPTGQGKGWHWHSFCKTQYANEKGIMNFIRCHTLVVAMLDYAKELGILQSVGDEGDYWEKRNLKELVLEIGRWDKFIAGFSAVLGKIVGDNNLQSEIKNHPNYERLREAGLQHFNGEQLSQLKTLSME